MSRQAMLVVAVVLIGGVTAGIAADSGYSISASPSVDTPTRDVTYQGDNYTVSALARVDPGGTVSVSVSAPPGDFYSVLLYNAEKNIVDKREGKNDSTVSFDAAFADGETYSPGTYVLTVSHDGIFQVIHPLVVSGYAVDVDAPSTALDGSTVTVDAEVSTIDGSKNISDVKLVIGDDQQDRRISMAADGDGTYSATVELTELGTGDYTLYVVVQGSKKVLGKPEVLGVSDSQSFSIVEETPTPTPSPTRSPEPTATDTSGEGEDSGGNAGGSAPGGSQSSTETSTSTPSETNTETSTVTEVTANSNQTTSATEPTDGDPATQRNQTRSLASSPSTSPKSQASERTDGTQTTSNADSVITPRPTEITTTNGAPQTNSPGQPLGMTSVLAALAAFSWLLVRRTR